MKDTSIFQSYKELGEYRFERSPGCLLIYFWKVYKKQSDGSFAYSGQIKQKKRETNIALYERGKALYTTNDYGE